jgi:hypothetical protein
MLALHDANGRRSRSQHISARAGELAAMDWSRVQLERGSGTSRSHGMGQPRTERHALKRRRELVDPHVAHYGVSAHVSIGAAYKGEKALDHYFVLVRQDG